MNFFNQGCDAGTIRHSAGEFIFISAPDSKGIVRPTTKVASAEIVEQLLATLKAAKEGGCRFGGEGLPKVTDCEDVGATAQPTAQPTASPAATVDIVEKLIGRKPLASQGGGESNLLAAWLKAAQGPRTPKVTDKPVRRNRRLIVTQRCVWSANTCSQRKWA